MLITTLHETTFYYEKPVHASFSEVRLKPVTEPGQICKSFSLTVDPLRPLTESVDYYGNTVFTYNILEAHNCVVLSGHSVVETNRNPFAYAEPLSNFDLQRARLDFTGFGGPVEHISPVEALAHDAGLQNCEGKDGQELFAAVQKLNKLIYQRFKYAPDTTDVNTRIAQVFAQAEGVCQDFAHIFIAVCRSAGLPARYVSGYLVTRRSRSATGSTASHAWAEVLLPKYGWSAFDPTNNLLANNSYIKIATGRDYRDASPTRGLYKGKGIEGKLFVRVHNIVHEDSVENAIEAASCSENDDKALYSQSPRELVG